MEPARCLSILSVAKHGRGRSDVFATYPQQRPGCGGLIDATHSKRTQLIDAAVINVVPLTLAEIITIALAVIAIIVAWFRR
jgi:hypothetical protein